jgi:hypothetical protein
MAGPQRQHEPDRAIDQSHGWPADARIIISALEAAPQQGHDRRRYPRVRHHVTGALRLFTDTAGAERRTLYVRDAAVRGLGFITPHRLPLGYGGRVRLPDRSGRLIEIECTIHRCREAVPGWFEGALAFNRDQFCFEEG